jgi:membrane protease YdiL (CAAX protease family)
MSDQDTHPFAYKQNSLVKELLTLLLCLFLGMSLGGLISYGIMASGADTIRTTKLLLVVQQITIFIIPAILFTYIIFRKDAASEMGLLSFASARIVFLSLMSIFTISIFIQYSYQLNQLIPMPEWMLKMEEDSESLIKQILVMDTTQELLFNIFLIGILPAVGEELLFRGVIQKRLALHLKRPQVAIWLSAIIFSAIHFQFQGFFPRMFLGALLGYLFWLGGSLWLAILVHFVNNAFQVLMYYLYQKKITDIDLEADFAIPWSGALVSLGITLTLIYLIKKWGKPVSGSAEIL